MHSGMFDKPLSMLVRMDDIYFNENKKSVNLVG